MTKNNTVTTQQPTEMNDTNTSTVITQQPTEMNDTNTSTVITQQPTRQPKAFDIDGNPIYKSCTKACDKVSTCLTCIVCCPCICGLYAVHGIATGCADWGN